jgi:hypothetical protein
MHTAFKITHVALFSLDITKMIILSDYNFFLAHPEELGVLLEILKCGMVTSASGSQYRLSLVAYPES